MGRGVAKRLGSWEAGRLEGLGAVISHARRSGEVGGLKPVLHGLSKPVLGKGKPVTRKRKSSTIHPANADKSEGGGSSKHLIFDNFRLYRCRSCIPEVRGFRTD